MESTTQNPIFNLKFSNKLFGGKKPQKNKFNKVNYDRR